MNFILFLKKNNIKVKKKIFNSTNNKPKYWDRFIKINNKINYLIRLYKIFFQNKT